MRLLGLMLLLLALSVGPVWADSLPVDPAASPCEKTTCQETMPEETKGEADLEAPGTHAAESPVRGPRLDPDHRWTPEVRAGASSPVDAPRARTKALRPWSERLALHVEICVFLC